MIEQAKIGWCLSKAPPDFGIFIFDDQSIAGKPDSGNGD